MRLYRNELSDPKANAQRNLDGRTHYVDEGKLRFHKSKVIFAKVAADGLLFAIVTSDAKDMKNTARGFRYVIFDVFGNVVERTPAAVDLEWFRTSAKALAGMYRALAEIDAKKVTREAMERARRNFAQDMLELETKLAALAE